MRLDYSTVNKQTNNRKEKKGNHLNQVNCGCCCSYYIFNVWLLFGKKIPIFFSFLVQVKNKVKKFRFFLLLDWKTFNSQHVIFNVNFSIWKFWKLIIIINNRISIEIKWMNEWTHLSSHFFFDIIWEYGFNIWLFVHHHFAASFIHSLYCVYVSLNVIGIERKKQIIKKISIKSINKSPVINHHHHHHWNHIISAINFQ